jgi:N-acetylated-alpha-linked acidic dipeptidase
MWGLLALRLSDEEILPFNYSSYVAELEVTCLESSSRYTMTAF